MNKITKNNDTLYWWEKNLLQIHVLQFLINNDTFSNFRKKGFGTVSQKSPSDFSLLQHIFTICELAQICIQQIFDFMCVLFFTRLQSPLSI